MISTHPLISPLLPRWKGNSWVTCPMANVHSNQYNKVCILYIVQSQVQSNVQCHGLSPAMPGMQMPQGAGSRPLLPVEVQCPLLNSRRCLGYTTQHCTLTSKATSIASTNTTSTSAPSTSQWLVSRWTAGEAGDPTAGVWAARLLRTCHITLGCIFWDWVSSWVSWVFTGCQLDIVKCQMPMWLSCNLRYFHLVGGIWGSTRPDLTRKGSIHGK